jgi:phage terminase large subunit
MAKKAGTLNLEGVPNPRQIEFFKATARHIAYGGARGGGKSWAMRRKFVLLALRYDGLKLLLLRRTLAQARENHERVLAAELAGYVDYKVSTHEFVFPNGSRIVIGYCDADRLLTGEFHFSGDRESVRHQTIEAALKLVLEHN